MTDQELLEIVREEVANTKVFRDDPKVEIAAGSLRIEFNAPCPLSASGMADALMCGLGNEMQFSPDFGPRFAPPHKPTRTIEPRENGVFVVLQWPLAD